MNTNAPAEDNVSREAAPSSGWVRFEDEEREKAAQLRDASQAQPSGSNGKEYQGAVINPETVHVNLERSLSRSPEKNDVSKNDGGSYSGAVINTESVHINLDRSMNRSLNEELGLHPDKLGPANIAQEKSVTLRSVDLNDVTNGRTTTGSTTRASGLNNVGVVRQGFANGDIIVTLLPVNTRWPWITPAQFRPELVPEELMAQGLTLTVEDYVHIMELLTNDVRFSVYNVCYKRILVIWIFTAFIVLLGLLFSGVTGLTLFGLGVMWLILNAAAIFFCMWGKIKLNKNLERCMAQVNKHLLRHKIILGLDDRGKISCHKVNLCFIFFDTTDCVKKLQEVIEREERDGRPVNREETAEERRQRTQFQQRMDIEDGDIIIQGSNTTRLSRKQDRAEMVFLRYSHRWAKEFVRKHLELSVDGAERFGLSRTPPRHCVSARCPCQYIEEHLKYKPRAIGVKPHVALVETI